MTALFLSANGARATSADLLIPFYGIPVADVELALDAPLVAPVSVVIGNLTMKMGILRQAPFAGSLTARLVGGAAGWGRAVPARAYANSAGVPLSMVFRDVAREAGETLALGADRTIGAFYVRESAPAQRVLRQLAGALWYIDPPGITRVATRPTARIKTPATVTDYAGGKGWLTVATEDLASWMPGATFSGNTALTPITVSATRIRTGDDGVLRLEVLTT